MPLKKYQQKRNFKKTLEPKGKISKTKKSKNLFVIQKHAASHLHYDFRLELNGVLLSWAVPKGPSLNPAVKRLAIHVEDHPVEYGSFEGTIPKGQYGGGTVMIWDKGEWHCDDRDPVAAYKKGDLSFTLKAQKLKGQWKLIRMHNDDKTWLLIKVKDKYANTSKNFDITQAKPDSVKTKKNLREIAQTASTRTVSTRHTMPLQRAGKSDLPPKKFPNIIHPQLATLVDAPPTGKNWLHEIKWDGYRLLAFKQGNKTCLYTRHHHNWTAKFRIIEKEINQLPIKNLILDGEIVVLDENQHSDFQLLQNSIKENNNDFYYYIFDILYYENYSLIMLPLLERKKILQNLLSQQENVFLRYSDHVIGGGKEVFAKTCQLGLEGIVSKEINSPYSQKRDQNWLKTKCIKRQEFVIGGFNPSSRRKYFRSLLLGTFDNQDKLIYCGNVGTGFTQDSLKTIHALLTKKITKTMPFSARPPASQSAVWVQPTLVAEIEFTEWTDAGTLRHPSFKGMRTDKPAKKIIREIEASSKNMAQNFTEMSTPAMNLTHPDKILYPEDRITKQEVADYYAAAREWILPHVSNRPLTLVRCPADYQHCFYQKHLNQKISGLNEITIKEKEGKGKYLYISDYEGLLALPQLGVLELHPWGSRIENIEHPDRIIFDLDPAPKIPWKKVVTAALEIKIILEELKLQSFVKNTGGKGLHVVVPIKPEYTWEEVGTFAQILVNYLVMNNSKDYIGKMSKSARTNKIFIDYLRNKRGATAVAPYSTRAKKHAPISTPLAWDELTNHKKDTFFTIKTIFQRLDALKQDPWKNFFMLKQSLNLEKFK